MSKKVSSNRNTVLTCIFLAVIVFAVFSRILQYDFINVDDPDYVTQNKHVQSGLTHKSIVWAFTTSHASNWHPLTWLSLMLDCQIFGLKPAAYHMTNLLLHIANVLLLFLVLKKTTRSFYRSAFVALLFGLHPLHIESVAWAAERKDVLSTAFWLLTMLAYADYARRRGIMRYLITVSLFAMGLMAKPMLITLPFVLLLMDYWPLERDEIRKIHLRPAKLILEKIPLFALAMVSIVITFIAQQRGDAVISISTLSLGWRINNAFISYVTYILKMIVPVKLAAFYPHTTLPSTARAVSAAILLTCITIAVTLGARRYKYLLTGWLWYLGTLVPVIGIVQVGSQAYADRYTYVPLIGLFIIIAWLVPDVLSGWRYKKIAITVSACLVTVLMAIVTTLQLSHWSNTIALFEHTLSVTKENCFAHNVLANAYGQIGQIDKSIEHSKKALRICPQYSPVHYNLAMGYYSKGDFQKAIEHWRKTLQLTPDYKESNFNIGVALERMGRTDEAIRYFRKELTINPDHQEANRRLKALMTQKSAPP